MGIPTIDDLLAKAQIANVENVVITYTRRDGRQVTTSVSAETEGLPGEFKELADAASSFLRTLADQAALRLAMSAVAGGMPRFWQREIRLSEQVTDPEILKRASRIPGVGEVLSVIYAVSPEYRAYAILHRPHNGQVAVTVWDGTDAAAIP